MKSKVLSIWDDLRSSYWFLPTLMAFGSIVLNQIALYFDREAGSSIIQSALLYTGSADGARSILSTIASSMISVAGVVFSMTLVTLSLTAQQFGSRTLRSMMRDRGNQFALGMFISTFLFCVLTIRQVRAGEQGAGVFVPQFSMLLAFIFAVGSLSVLIYFIHHIAFVIQAPHVIASAAQDLSNMVRTKHSSFWSRFASSEVSKVERSTVHPVITCSSAYIRRYDYQSLANFAAEKLAVIQIERPTGNFVVTGETLMTVRFQSEPSAEELEDFKRHACDLVSLGPQPTAEDDLRYLIGQILTIVLLALSPAVNNPLQAILCIQRLRECLTTIGLLPPRGDFLFDSKKRLGLIDREIGFKELFELAFREIRINSKQQITVMLELLHAFEQMHQMIPKPEIQCVIALEHQRTVKQLQSAFPNEEIAQAYTELN